MVVKLYFVFKMRACIKNYEKLIVKKQSFGILKMRF